MALASKEGQMRVDSYIVQTPQSLRDSSPSLWEQPEKALFSLREQQKKALPMRQGEYGKAGRGYDKQAPRPLSHCVTAPLTYGSSRRLNRSSFTAWLCLVVVLLFVASSCDRRPLEVMEPTKAQIRIDVDWLTYFGARPHGMTVMVWGDGWERPYTTSTNDVESVKVALDPGHYRLLIFNKSFDEYGSMKFADTDSYELISARGKDITQYVHGDWDKDITYMADPENIGVVVDEFTITDDMLLEQVNFYPYEEWIERHYGTTRWVIEPDGTYSMQVEARPQITKLNVWVQIKGRNNMRSMTGNISGMADGFYLSQVWRTTDERYMLFETDKWSPFVEDDQDDNTGYMFYTMPVFGLPHGKEYLSQRTEDNNVLKLHIVLRDGSSLDFTYDVGKIIRYRGLDEQVATRLMNTTRADLDAGIDIDTTILLDLQLDLVINVDTVDDIPDLPDVDPEPPSSSGFDAQVDPWDDGGTVDVGL